MYVSLGMKLVVVPQTKGNAEMGTSERKIFMGLHIVTEMEIIP